MPDPTILKMTVADALERADDWTKGLTLHPLSEGMRVAILVLATEVRRLQSNQRAMAALADERAGETFEAKLEAAKLRGEVERLRAADSAKRLALARLYRWARAGDPRIEYGGDHPVALAREALLEEGEASNGS